MPPLELPDGLHAVHARHLQVHQHYVRLQLAGHVHRLSPIDGLAHHLEVLFPAQHGREAFPDHRVIVRHQDADHGRLTHRNTWMTVPWPGALSTVKTPFASWQRSRIPMSPNPPACPAGRGAFGSKPRPSSRMVRATPSSS